MDASMLIKRKAMGPTGKKVAMAAAPVLVWCHVLKGLSQQKVLPWMCFKFNVIEMDENADVTFGVKDYPPWVSSFLDLERSQFRPHLCLYVDGCV